VVAEQNGNHLRESWTEVLRCVSRFELLQQLTAGVPTDALLFAMPDKAAAGSAADKLKRRILRRKGGEEEGPVHDSFSSINDMGLHASECAAQPATCALPLPSTGLPCYLAAAALAALCSSATCPPLLTAPPPAFLLPAGTREVDKKHLPPADVMASVDVQELNRLFVNSGRLDSEAIVQFVKTLGAIAQEELRPVACPRVFSLTKIVEIAHFNMGRIRWAGRGG
jgi:brefeldin A-inhibited guanine nucleotide-exchange protein